MSIFSMLGKLIGGIGDSMVYPLSEMVDGMGEYDLTKEKALWKAYNAGKKKKDKLTFEEFQKALHLSYEP